MLNLKLKKSFLVIPFLSLTLGMMQNTVVNAAPIDDVRFALKNYYYKSVSHDILSRPTIEEIIAGLNDPYTTYMTEEEYNSFVGYINNNVCGIGIYMNSHKDGLEIERIVENSPAEKSELKAGDVITKVDGKSLKGVSYQEAGALLRGDAGTTVDITIKRGSQTINKSIKREQIHIPTVSYEILDENIGYVSIESFGEKTADEFNEAIRYLNSKKVDSFIFDLRNNSGGYVNTALEIAGSFVKDNTVMKKINRNGTIKEEEGNYNILKPYVNKPSVFLVNENSASASEILSAAIKDYDKACFIGQNTYGKGVAQAIVPIEDGGMLKFTKEQFVSPKGRKINETGIAPHVEISENAESLLIARMLLNNNLFLSRSGNSDLELVSNEEEYTDLKFNGFYFNCEIFSNLDDVSPSKSYKITFDKEVSMEEAEKHIKMIDGDTGKEVELTYKKKDGNVIEVKPKKFLTRGNSYVLIVNDELRNTEEGKLKEGAMTFINVKE